MGARFCSIEDCGMTRFAKGYCRRHYGWIVEGRNPRDLRPAVNPADRLEDVRWMVETGECLEGAARRLGISQRGLSLFLARHGGRDLLTVLTRRNPRDYNASCNVVRELA